VRSSNHQFGRALDLVAAQHRASAAYADERKILKVELFKAGADFLEKLIELNGADECTSVEVLLEQRSNLLWQYRAKADGTIESKKGGKYASVVGTEPAGEDAAILKAAGHATHVHIGWKPKNTPALQLPEPEIHPYDSLLQVPTEFRNLILIAKEDGSVDPDDQLPLNHVAETIKRHLETLDPDIATEIREVANPVEFLAYLNAYRPPQYNINYFFSLSHAWQGGLTLLNFDETEIPYQNRDSAGNVLGPEIHDATVLRDINWLSRDPRMPEASEFDFSEEGEFLEVGPDDYEQVKTNQIRVANLRYLLPESKIHLKRTFAQAKAVFILGCKAAGEQDDPSSSFCEALAETIEKPVYGASYYSKVFQYEGGEWEEVDLARGDPAPPPEKPVLLIPGSLGGRQLIKHLLVEREIPEVTPPPQTLDLIKVFKAVLRRCDPPDAE
jgi:hypothetical protein